MSTANVLSGLSTFLAVGLSLLGAAVAGSSGLQHMHHDRILHTIGNASYFTPTHRSTANFPYSTLGDFLDTDLASITVLPVQTDEDGLIDTVTVGNAIGAALGKDDVLSPYWLAILLLVPLVEGGAGQRIHLGYNVIQELNVQYGVKKLALYRDPVFYSGTQAIFNTQVSQPQLHNQNYVGPYLAQRKDEQLLLFPVYRLYSDLYRTFITGVYPLQNGTGRYKAFREVDEWGYALIPVPSRLYADPSVDNGVHAKRIGVKDIYHLSGVPTGSGSRAYAELYGERNETADPVRRLEDLGGNIVGKTKTSSFAFGTNTNEGAVDEQYPLSPRSDLYQSCFSSSSGSGCAVAAYDWLDFAIRSDTTGSVRGPAAITGVYGNRPTTGIISLQGVIPLSNYSDTAGVLGRDPLEYTKFIDSWYNDSTFAETTYPESPNHLVVADDYLVQESADAQNVIESFLNRMTKMLDLRVTRFNLDESLAEIHYDSNRLKKLYTTHFEKVVPYWTYIQNGRKFQIDYAAENGGRLPPVDPAVRNAWRDGETLVSKGYDKEYAADIAELKTFSSVYNEKVLVPSPSSCTKNILVYSHNAGGVPVYREGDLNANELGSRNTSIPGKEFCALAECTEIVIPLGQVEFQSVISGRKEFQPVTVTLAAHKGCDFVLSKFINLLAESGLIDRVKTGREAF